MATMDSMKNLSKARVERAEARRNEIIKKREEKIGNLEHELREARIDIDILVDKNDKLEKENIDLGSGLIPQLNDKIDKLSSDRDFLLNSIKNWFEV